MPEVDQDLRGAALVLDAINREGAGVLLVAKRDRLARDVIVGAVAERMAERLGARVLSADGTGNGDGPEHQLMRHLIDCIASYERAWIGARTKVALRVKKMRGEREGAIPLGDRLADDAGKLKEQWTASTHCLGEGRIVGETIRHVARSECCVVSLRGWGATAPSWPDARAFSDISGADEAAPSELQGRAFLSRRAPVPRRRHVRVWRAPVEGAPPARWRGGTPPPCLRASVPPCLRASVRRLRESADLQADLDYGASEAGPGRPVSGQKPGRRWKRSPATPVPTSVAAPNAFPTSRAVPPSITYRPETGRKAVSARRPSISGIRSDAPAW